MLGKGGIPDSGEAARVLSGLGIVQSHPQSWFVSQSIKFIPNSSLGKWDFPGNLGSLSPHDVTEPGWPCHLLPGWQPVEGHGQLTGILRP